MNEGFSRDLPIKSDNEFCMNSCEPATMYVLQSLQSLSASQLFNQQGSSSCKRKSEIKKDQNDNVSQIFEGQSFPYRLWHLINNDHFQEVIHWSPDGNSIIFPVEKEFVVKVLRRTQERIFKTESMKSFVRQLNLYGFHKVQLDKDGGFQYLHDVDKRLWPEAVFGHPCFKKGRHELLEQVKRRCRVKQTKAQEKINKNMAQGLYNQYTYQVAPAVALENSRKANYVIQYPQLVPTSVGSEQMMSYFPNVMPPFGATVDRRVTKRKLHFNEEKEDKKKQQFAQYPSPFFFYPQTFINNNYQQMMPPSGWGVAPGGIAQPVLPGMPPYPENINFFQSGPSNVTPPDANITRTQDEETPPGESSLPCSSGNSNQEKPKSKILSPLAAFCASLFRPNTASSPIRSCDNPYDNDAATQGCSD